MSSQDFKRHTQGALWKGAAVLALAVAVLGGSGCARQEIIQASDAPQEAPVVTVRTLSTRPRRDKKRLALNASAKSAVAADEPKAEPKPRRRRRARSRRITPPEAQTTTTPATPRESAPEKEAHTVTPAEPPPAASRPATTPEHVIDPRPPASEPKPTPDAPTAPEADPNR